MAADGETSPGDECLSPALMAAGPGLQMGPGTTPGARDGVANGFFSRDWSIHPTCAKNTAAN